MLRNTIRSSLGAILAAAALAAAGPAGAATPLESGSFPIGTEGALCEAQGVMLGQARATLFDRKWALICSAHNLLKLFASGRCPAEV